MRSTSLTNLFKCSTRDEQEKLKPHDCVTCFNLYLLPEVSMLRPQVILALGNEVDYILQRLGKNKDLPPIVKVKHPSYFYKKSDEKTELAKAKKSLVKYL